MDNIADIKKEIEINDELINKYLKELQRLSPDSPVYFAISSSLRKGVETLREANNSLIELVVNLEREDF
jgi:chaperonin cofactor prefoldin